MANKRTLAEYCQDLAELEKKNKNYKASADLKKHCVILGLLAKLPAEMDGVVEYLRDAERVAAEAAGAGAAAGKLGNKWNILHPDRLKELLKEIGFEEGYIGAMNKTALLQLLVNVLLRCEVNSAVHSKDLEKLKPMIKARVATLGLIEKLGGIAAIQRGLQVDKSGAIEVYAASKDNPVGRDKTKLKHEGATLGAYRVEDYVEPVGTEPGYYKSVRHIFSNAKAAIPDEDRVTAEWSMTGNMHQAKTYLVRPDGTRDLSLYKLAEFREESAKRGRDQSKLPAMEFIERVSKGGRPTGSTRASSASALASPAPASAAASANPSANASEVNSDDEPPAGWTKPK